MVCLVLFVVPCLRALIYVDVLVLSVLCVLTCLVNLLLAIVAVFFIVARVLFRYDSCVVCCC